MAITDANIILLKKIISDALLAEWKAQGHYMDGKVVNEMEWVVEREFDRTSLVAMMYPYGAIHETGVSAANIPFNPGSGAKKSKYITALMNFVEKRMGITDLKTKKSVAFAIAHTQKREGMPTSGAFKYTTTGQRTGWINEALTKNIDTIGGFIKQFYAEFMRAEFENVITKNIKAL